MEKNEECSNDVQIPRERRVSKRKASKKVKEFIDQFENRIQKTQKGASTESNRKDKECLLLEKDIRNFFPSNRIKTGKSAPPLNYAVKVCKSQTRCKSNSQSAVNRVNTADRQNIGIFSQTEIPTSKQEQSPANKKRVVCKVQSKRSLKKEEWLNRAKSLKQQRRALNCKQNTESANFSDFSTISTDDESSDFHTPMSSFDIEDCDDVFLYSLAGLIGGAKNSNLAGDSSKEVLSESEGNTSKDKMSAIDDSISVGSASQNCSQSMENISTQIKGQNLDEHSINQEMEVETNNQGNPKSMAVDAVLAMFDSLKKEIADQLTNFKHTSAEETKKVITTAIAEASEKESEEVKNLKAEVAHLKHKSQVLTEVVNRMHTDMTDITQKIENLELNNARRMLIFSGFSPSTNKKEEAIQEITDFINECIGVQVVVESYFVIGPNNVKDLNPTVVNFQYMEDKNAVLNNKQVLNGILNAHGKQIYVNEYTPASTQERRGRERAIINSTKPEKGPNPTKYVKGGIAVSGVLYRKQVTPPTPRELIEMSTADLKKCIEMTTYKGAQLNKENSCFSGYATEIKTHQHVREIYKKIKLLQPNARHIAVAYWIQGSPAHIGQDYHDDGEIGCGKRLLQLLQNHDLKKFAVFIARKYGGIKMGASRFDCYMNAAVSAINQYKKENKMMEIQYEATTYYARNQVRSGLYHNNRSNTGTIPQHQNEKQSVDGIPQHASSTSPKQASLNAVRGLRGNSNQYSFRASKSIRRGNQLFSQSYRSYGRGRAGNTRAHYNYRGGQQSINSRRGQGGYKRKNHDPHHCPRQLDTPNQSEYDSQDQLTDIESNPPPRRLVITRRRSILQSG